MRAALQVNVAQKTVLQTYKRLDNSFKQMLSRNDVRYILELEEVYYQLAWENEINITAFTDASRFVLREARQQQKLLTAEQIDRVFEAEKAYFKEILPLCSF